MKKILIAITLVFSMNAVFSQVSEKELLKKTEETVAKIQAGKTQRVGEKRNVYRFA